MGGVVDMSTIDWYGNVSLVVFFAGCNFRCPYCQNSGLIPIDSGQEVDADYLRQRIKIGRSLLDAVVLTGGEPILQPEGIEAIALMAKEFGLKLMLNTNGSRPDAIKGLLEAGLVDRVALDIKAPFNATDYSKITGLGEGGGVYEKVRRSLDVCNDHRVEVEARTTVALGVSDSPEFIRGIAAEIRGRCDMYCLQQFDNLGEVLSSELKSLEPPPKELMVELAGVAQAEGVENVYIRTRKNGLERIGYG